MSKTKRLVSASALVSPRSEESSELEFGLIVAWNAFSRWASRCMAAAGRADLGITDILVLHHLNHRDRPKKLADICFVLNYEDTHVIAYALKKLVGHGLAEAQKQGKEMLYTPTAEAQALLAKYRELRDDCLLAGMDMEINPQLDEAARVLRLMSGVYDQAARSVSSL